MSSSGTECFSEYMPARSVRVSYRKMEVNGSDKSGVNCTFMLQEWGCLTVSTGSDWLRKPARGLLSEEPGFGSGGYIEVYL
jgi:hypothetical protein